MERGEQNRVIPQKCPICGAKRNSLSYMPLGFDGEKTVIHISCMKCASAAMIFVSQNEGGIMTVGVLTDTTPAEARSFFNSNVVSDNDVIAMHNHLKSCEGYVDDII